MSATFEPSSETFQRILGALNASYWEWVPGEDTILASEDVAEWMGFTPGNWTNGRFYEWVHPDDRAAYQAWLVGFLKSDQRRSEITFRYVRHDGRVGWARSHAWMERDATGRATRMTGTVADVTAEKTRETEINANVARQEASVEVLKAIAASPGDLQPVFELITRRLAELCHSRAGLLEFDGSMFHLRATHGFAPDLLATFLKTFPVALDPAGSHSFSRAVMERRTIHIPDVNLDPLVASTAQTRTLRGRSIVCAPILRDGKPIGAIALNDTLDRPGGFSPSQITFLEMFAEQAVIAITSAETFRALQARTADLQESLEYQTATTDVLKVISRSTFDLDPVLETLTAMAARLCGADQALIFRRTGDLFQRVANFGFPIEVWNQWLAEGLRPLSAVKHYAGVRATLEGTVIHIDDVAAEPGYVTETVMRARQRTTLAVPLKRDGDTIGAFVLARQRVEPFTQRQVELVTAFADQAVIAIENTRLLTDQREALEQQTATAEVLQVINTSPGDLTPVFDAILEKAHTLCGASLGTLQLYEGDWVKVAAIRGAPDALASMLCQGWAYPARASIPMDTMSHIDDSRDILAQNPDNAILRAIVEIGEVRTQLHVPLLKEGVVIGRIAAARREVRPFAAKEIALLESFAAQAVIAMENARLLGELRERTAELAERNDAFAERIDHQAATIDVLKAMSASPDDVRPVFDLIVRRARELCNAGNSSLLEYDGSRLHFRSTTENYESQTVLAAYIAQYPMEPRPTAMMGRCVLEGRIIHVRDTNGPEPLSEAARALGIQSGIAVPLIRDGGVLGVISLTNNHPGGYSDTQVELLQTFAEQAVIAITSAETFRALQTRTAELAERNDAFAERIEHQAATIDVLKEMSSSPGDPQPVFELITHQATAILGTETVGLFEYDGELVHYRTTTNLADMAGAGAAATYGRLWPRPPDPGSITCRAILDSAIIHIRDIAADPSIGEMVRNLGHRTQVSVPLLRDGRAIGALSTGTKAVDGISDTQIELLKTFAEQAVIAITSAETFRALQARTADLQDALARQTATAEVLGVINESRGDITPVFQAIVDKAMAICDCTIGALGLYDGVYFKHVVTRGFPAWYVEQTKDGILADQNVSFRAMLGGATHVHIPDLIEGLPGLYPDGNPPEATRLLVRDTLVRSVLGVPLRKGGQVLGYIGAWRRDVRPFSDKEIGLMENFAAQAVIAMENARLLTEQAEALERQTATAEVLAVINASPGDLVPVFDTILAKAHALCGAELGSLGVFEGGMFRKVARYGYRGEADAFLEQPYPPGPQHAPLLRGEPIHVPDVMVFPWPDPERALAYFASSGLGTWLEVPLWKDGALVGTISGFRRQPRPFSDKEITLLQSFAAQAVIAMENARLLTEQAEALERQTAMAAVLGVINANPGQLTPVFDAILEKAHAICGAEMGSLLIYEDGMTRAVATHGVPEAVEALLRRGFPSTTPAHSAMLQGERLFQVADIRASQATPGTPLSFEPLVALRQQTDGRTMLMIPLRKDGVTLGAISAYHAKVRPFSENEVLLLENFAAQAVIAMENARLLGALRERTAELAERNDAFAERIDHQAATIDVLKEMSASPGDAQPVFDLICARARVLTGAMVVALFEYDGELIHFRSNAGIQGDGGAAAYAAYSAAFPQAPSRGSPAGRAILDGRTWHVRNVPAEPGISEAVRNLRYGTQVSIPLLRDGRVIGALSTGSTRIDDISDTQIELLQTFAEQAVIAITSAETFRALRARTADLQESLEYQTATSDVLQVISQSTFDLQPVFDAIVRTAVRLCDADFANIANRDGDDYRIAAIFTTSPDFDELMPKGNVLPVTRQNLSGRAVLSGQVVQTEDITNDPDYNMGNLDALRRIGVGTVMTVPLVRDGVAIGTLSLGRRRVQLFATAQVDLIRTFADQAVIAIENARLLTEQREALEQQTATAELLGVINANPGNLTPVFDAILEKSLRICRSAFGLLAVFDSEGGQTVRSERGLTPALAEFRARNPQRGRSPNVQKVIETKRPVHQLDIREGEGYRAGHPNPRSIADLGGARTLLLVPLIKDQTVMGLIQIYRQEVRAFSDKEIALLENFAAQAVIAIENTRLLTEQREALERQTATAEVLQVINANPGDLSPVFDVLLDKALSLCDAEYGVLATYDGEHFDVPAVRGFPPALAAEFRVPRVPTPGSATGRLAAGEDLFQVLDAADTDEYRAGATRRRGLVDEAGARTVIWVALRLEGKLLGAFTIYRKVVRAFTERQITLLRDFAAQAVIAIENARLLNEIKRRQGELDVTFESMGDGVALFDETHHLAAWNQNFQDMLDVPTDIVTDHPAFVDYIRYLADRGEYGAEPGDMVQRLLAQPGQRANFERTRPNGQTIQIRTNPTPTGGFVVIYTDITERKRAEEALRATRDAAENALRELRIAQANLVQAEKMASLGQLTAGIAHEIKNPLNFVNNFAALSVELLDEFKESAAPALAALTDDQRTDIDDVTEMLTTNLRKIEEHGKRADGIVRAMLEHSRGASTERRAVDINGLVDEALNLAYHGARAQDQSFNVALERDFAAGIAPIEVNPQDLTRVFLNIFSNGFYAANKRMREQGGEAPTVRVSTRAVADTVEIRIRDNGTGIPPEIRDKLFEPFFTTKPTGEGTGLGLSITYDIVTKAHGGAITVDSQPGAFTEFSVTLPRRMFAPDETRA